MKFSTLPNVHDFIKTQSPDGSVGTATDYVMDGRASIPVMGNRLFVHSVQSGSGAYSASYPMGVGGSFPGNKAAGA
jgi:hypothetical protein